MLVFLGKAVCTNYAHLCLVDQDNFFMKETIKQSLDKPHTKKPTQGSYNSVESRDFGFSVGHNWPILKSVFFWSFFCLLS